VARYDWSRRANLQLRMASEFVSMTMYVQIAKRMVTTTM